MKWATSSLNPSYSPSSQSAASRQSVSRWAGRKKPKCPIGPCPSARGSICLRSGRVPVKPVSRRSIAGGVAQGSSSIPIARNAPARKIRKFGKRRIVKEVALAHDPSRPFQKHVLGQVFANTRPPGGVAECARDQASDIHHGIYPIVFGRQKQPPIAGLGRDQQCTRDCGVVGEKPDRLAPDRMSDRA